VRIDDPCNFARVRMRASAGMVSCSPSVPPSLAMAEVEAGKVPLRTMPFWKTTATFLYPLLHPHSRNGGAVASIGGGEAASSGVAGSW